MSNTANFDYCVQLGLGPLKAIFHLALKNEEIFPHNLPPIPVNLGGHAATVSVRLLDDETDPADLSLDDSKHIRFDLPLEISVQIPDSPDPSLSQVTLKSTVTAPGKLNHWPVDGDDQLGIEFSDITPAAVTVPSLTGLPTLDSGRFEAALHTRYESLPTHSFTAVGNTLNVYDGTRDPTLNPPNKAGNPEIHGTLETHGSVDYLKATLPIHATITNPIPWANYGIATFYRQVDQQSGTVCVLMAQEPADPALASTIAFDGGGPIAAQIASALKPQMIAVLAGFGSVCEPWFTDADAKALIAEQAAAYLKPLRFPFFTPRSGDPDHPLSTPVGFLLPPTGTLAVLMNRRSGAEADDFAPDDFRGGNALALAIGRAMLDETIAKAIADQFPGLNGDGAEVTTAEGTATLHSLTVTPSDPGEHDTAEGHLWTEGEAEVHIECWPDPDVSFSAAIFLRLDVVETDTECSGTFRAEVGDFDASESCCDVFVDLLIPVVGWIMLGVVESMIDSVGGELADQIAGEQSRALQPVPPVVAGVAELQGCLEGCETSSQGLVLPGKLRIRREGTSFEDLADNGDLPRP
ncbi:MAG: hypothetical protein JWO25_2553 [Alphaproteobacteria bacterium]|nr:hypothetical protein [Alphaproteobacteria bacterium]